MSVGTYEVRYILQNTFTSVAVSNTFTVAMGGYTCDPTGTGGSIRAGTDFQVDWTAPAGHNYKDWVALYKVGDPNTAYVSWAYVLSSGTSGSVILHTPGVAPPQSKYEIRYFLKDSFILGATGTKQFQVN